MKKWLAIAVVCAGLYYYLAYTEPGKSQYEQLTAWFQRPTDKIVSNFTPGDDKTTIYKIQNPDGTWSFSNKAPKDTSKVVEQVYRSDTNVLPSPASKPPGRED